MTCQGQKGASEHLIDFSFMDSSPRSSSSADSVQSLQASVQYLAGRVQHLQRRVETLEELEQQQSARLRIVEYCVAALRRLFRSFCEDSGPAPLEP